MNKTIRVEFSPQDLPAWAQRIPEVVKLAERNLGFRMNLFRAKRATCPWAKVLIREARLAGGRAS